MRIKIGLAALALAGVMFAAPQTSSAASMGPAVVPALDNGTQAATLHEVTRRKYRRHHRWNRRHGYYHRRYYPRRYGYGYRRYGWGPGFSLYIGPRRRHYRRYWW